MTDRFLFLGEIALQFPGRRSGEEVTVEHLRKIAEAQHGGLRHKGGRARFSNAALASYPRFIKGPGGKWGCFESILAAYWDSLRNTNAPNVVMFRARKAV